MKYDFYYSAEQAKHIKRICLMLGNPYYENYINGMQYTEMIRHGEKPHTNTSAFPDFHKICTDDRDKVIRKY